MNSPFDNVKDSSIWYKPAALKLVNSLDTRIYVGVVREARNDANTNELRYLVEIHHKNDTILSNCRMVRSFGGVFNYEDHVMQGYTYNASSNNQNGIVAVPGDIVLVSQFGGQGREGVILGSLTHPARKSFLDTTKGPQYRSEFNGIETWINEDGEYTQTFKGQPTNLDVLSDTPNQPVPEPEYDEDVGSSFLKWDKTGSYTINDNATDDDKIQRFFMDKKNGTVQLDSGKVSLKFTKKEQSVLLTCKTSENQSETSITYKTKNFEGEATDHVHVKTPKYVVESGKIRFGEEGASEALVLGTTFRQKQKSMDNTLVAQFTAAATAVGLAATQITAAGAAAASPPLTPIAASLTAAGAALVQAQTALQQIMTAIQQFESSGAANDYLSNVSKTK